MKRINGQSNQRFSIRKCTIGAVSVLLGTFLVVGVNQVSADEQVVAPTSSEVTAGFVVDTKANQTVTTPVVTSDTEQTPTQAESTPATPTTTQVATPTTASAIVTTPIAEADTTKTMIPVVENETSKQSTETSDVVAPETAEADKVTDLSVTTNTKESTEASLNTENVASRTTVEAPTAPTTTEVAAPISDTSNTMTVSVTNFNFDNFFNFKLGTENLSSVDALTAMLGTSLVAVNTTANVDDYPAYLRSASPDSLVDPWHMYNRECVSFVAYRLSSRNHYELPAGYGSAVSWASDARAHGVTVDNTPAVGSVAWLASGHVAWVKNVSNGNVEVEEYNWNYNHNYHADVHPISYYNGYIHFKDLSGSVTTPISTNTGGGSSTAIPSSGQYTFTSRTGIKNEPKISSADIAYYDAGSSVNYDQKLTADGYNWISYLSYSGTRRYIAIDKVVAATPTTQVKTTGTINIQNVNAQQGTFDVIITNVASNTGVKTVQVPVWSTRNNQDDIIWYNASKQSNGDYKVTVHISDHKNDRGEYSVHLYYIQNDGKQVGVGGTKVTVPEAVATVSIPSSGRYTFKVRSGIKSEPRMSASDIAYYDAGNSVNYDSTLTADGHQWISYVSYSGVRRYISIN